MNARGAGYKLSPNQTYLVSQTESTSQDEIQVEIDLVCAYSKEILFADERIREKARFKNSANKQRDENKHWCEFWRNARAMLRRASENNVEFTIRW